ncbi:MAG: RNA-binding S4 domain-containing protein [Methyloligellaceae bacterium]
MTSKARTQIASDAAAEQSQRIDKWLWFTRLTKTRSQASRMISDGKVRINKARVQKPASTVRIGDVVTAMINRNLRVLEVKELGSRRGPASEAQLLYSDITPEAPAKPKRHSAAVKSPTREPGSGRPTKRERRKLDRFRDKFETDLEGL